MTDVGTTRSTSLLNTWTPPILAIRSIHADDVKSGRSTGRVGKIRHDLVPLSYTTAPGPEGGTMELGWRGQFFIRAGQKWDDIEKFEGQIFTLEKRANENNRALQQVLFRGRRAGLTLSYDVTANSIGLVCRDYWFDASFPPCRFPAQGKTIGQICRILTDSYYYERYVSSGSVSVRPRYLEQRIFPLNDNGEPSAFIDEELMTSTIRPGTLNASGQGFAQFFAEMIKKGYGGTRVPDIDYTSTGQVRLVARLRGTRERTLTVGSPGADGETKQSLATTQSLKGTIDYSGIKNRAVGYGAPIREIRPMELEPGWTSADETAVAANLSLNDTPRYSHVFRRFTAPDRFWAMVANGRGFADTLEDRVRFYKRSSVPGESTTSWSEFREDWNPIRERSDGETSGTIIDDLASIKPGDYKELAIEFVTPQRYHYYTAAQTALGVSGEDRGAKSTSPYEIVMEAVVIGDELSVDTGIIGDKAEGVRTVIIENQNAQKISHTGHYETLSDGTRSDLVETPTDGMVRDDSAFFLSQANDYVTEQTKAAIDMYAGIAVFEPDWRIGDRIVRIVNDIGQVLFDEIEWDLLRIPHSLNQGGTDGWKTNHSLTDISIGGSFGG